MKNLTKHLSTKYAFVMLGIFCTNVAIATPEAACETVHSSKELDNALVSWGSTRPTVVYARADWANSIGDDYVPSIAYRRTIGDMNCLLVDITLDGGVDILKRFDSIGVPFFALLNAENAVVAKRLGGTNFSTFQMWFESSRGKLVRRGD